MKRGSTIGVMMLDKTKYYVVDNKEDHDKLIALLPKSEVAFPFTDQQRPLTALGYSIGWVSEFSRWIWLWRGKGAYWTTYYGYTKGTLPWNVVDRKEEQLSTDIWNGEAGETQSYELNIPEELQRKWVVTEVLPGQGEIFTSKLDSKCKCGKDKFGFMGHSTWCPANNNN
jgi:hypothetical protein